MNREEAARAVEVLAASPASRWIGNKIVNGVWLQKCMRCGAEETLAMPPDVHGPKDVPVGFDEKLFDWKRSFQVAHEACLEISSAVDARSAESRSVATDVTMKRVLRCGKHGLRTWRGHIMCDACGRTYQTIDEQQPGYAPEICRCVQRLLPPVAERVGDVLGLRTGGEDWTARPICYLCHRYFTKHHDGRVPVEGARN